MRKCKGPPDSCRGSNNCYVWALDFQQLSKKMDKLDKGCPKSKTLCAENQGSDNEFLLADRAAAYSSNCSPADYEMNTTKESSRRSSIVEESSDFDFK